MSRVKNPSKQSNATAPPAIPPEYLALGPLDGRYHEVGQKLAPYFSEYALVKYRVGVEVKWLLELLKVFDPGSKEDFPFDIGPCSYGRIAEIITEFDADGMRRVKEIEREINHDVKAVELYVAEELTKRNMHSLTCLVHIGCTSEDITNLAYARMVNNALREVWLPAAEQLIRSILKFTNEYARIPMLAHTHGQPATPTTVGKEFGVHAFRLREAKNVLCSIPIYGKFNGATGNYSALSIAYPDYDWGLICEQFVESTMRLDFNPYTTQIESHDWLCQLLDALRRFNNILRNFDKDIWLYISMDYLKQIPVAEEVGSSTMPHKINPIRFENSEANTEMSNAICHTLSDELALSRLQRDLTDSSLLRNIGMAFGYSLQAIQQTTHGLAKVTVNQIGIENDLNDRWEVLAEPIQTMLRKYGIPSAYNQLKQFTRGRQVTKTDIHDFIATLTTLSETDRQTLLDLTPSRYIGKAADLAFDIAELNK